MMGNRDTESKMKTSSLCKSIFDIISGSEVISDEELMRALSQNYGSDKTENIKRRKYDIINILENSKIIHIYKNQKEKGEARYSIGEYYVPNYEQKKKKIGKEIDEAQKKIKEKISEIKWLENVGRNFSVLIERNKLKTVDQTQKIQFPFHFIEGKVLELEHASSYGENKIFMQIKKGTTIRNGLEETDDIIK